MKLRAVIITTILLVASSVTAGELQFIQNSGGVTSHVIYNGQLYPVASDGTVILDGSKIPVTVLMAAAQPQQPRMQSTVQPSMQPPQQWQNPDLQQPQAQTPNQSQSATEYNNTKSATKREIKRETRKIFRNGVGSDIGSGVVEDLLDSFL